SAPGSEVEGADEAADEVRGPWARLPPGAVFAEPVRRSTDSTGRSRPSERHDPLRQQSAGVGARPELQGALGGQPVRGGRQLLPVERGGESGADHYGERAAGGRPPDREAGMKRLLLLLVASVGHAHVVTAVDSIGLTVSDLDRSVEFYSKVLN